MSIPTTPTEFVLYTSLFCDVAEVASFPSEEAAYLAYESMKGDTPMGYEHGVLPREDFERYARMLRNGEILM